MTLSVSLVDFLENDNGNQKFSLFLDTTALIAYVSEICHYTDNKKIIFDNEALQHQNDDNSRNPQLDLFDLCFQKAQQLYTIAEVTSEFLSILETLGNEHEQERGSQLLESIVIVPSDPSLRFQNLTLSKKITAQNILIFGTSDNLNCKNKGQSITDHSSSHTYFDPVNDFFVDSDEINDNDGNGGNDNNRTKRVFILTSNKKFLSACSSQKINVKAILHRPRSLVGNYSLRKIN